jgi:membrane-bound serine protease (ClpP class)
MFRSDGTIESLGETERAKAASPIIADFLDSAGRNGHDPTLSLAMVSVNHVVRWLENTGSGERRFVDGQKATEMLATGSWRVVADAGVPDPINGPTSLLTLNTNLAMKLGLAKATAASVGQLAGTRALGVRFIFAQDLWQQTVEFLSEGWVRALLISIFMTCLYISLHAPGHGAAEVIAVVSLSLAIGVPLLTGYAQWWEIAMILGGIVLLALEIFVIPGFGFIGVLGLILTLVGLLLTFVAPEPGRSPLAFPRLPGTWSSIQTGLIVIVGAMIASIGVCSIIRQYLPKMPFFRRLVLSTAVGESESAMVGSISSIEPSDLVPSVGARGLAITDLRPGGSVQFRDAAGAVHVVSVISISGFLQRGETVVVSAVDGPTIHVCRQEEAT